MALVPLCEEKLVASDQITPVDAKIVTTNSYSVARILDIKDRETGGPHTAWLVESLCKSSDKSCHHC